MKKSTSAKIYRLSNGYFWNHIYFYADQPSVHTNPVNPLTESASFFNCSPVWILILNPPNGLIRVDTRNLIFSNTLTSWGRVQTAKSELGLNLCTPIGQYFKNKFNSLELAYSCAWLTGTWNDWWICARVDANIFIRFVRTDFLVLPPKIDRCIIRSHLETARNEMKIEKRLFKCCSGYLVRGKGILKHGSGQ